MEAISYDKNDFEHLMLISQGHVAFQCLYTGLELGIFDLFSEKGPLNYQEISEELRLNESSCKILIRALYSLNLLNKVNDKFTNSTIAISFLTNKSQLKFKDILGWQSKIVYPGIIDFTDAIKTNSNIGLRHFSGEGDNLYERLSSNKELEMVFQKSMSALSSSANQYFLQHLDLKGINTLVDVGGGEGTNLKAI
ncbi:MAG: hypothetical protein KDD58_15775, partial [Bdellovibrionales bacterium]|nr:hypothetical protein [Bdellovibrionales bacterium]